MAFQPKTRVRRSALAIGVAAAVITTMGMFGGTGAALAASPLPSPKPPTDQATPQPVNNSRDVGVTSAPIHADLAPSNDNFANATAIPGYQAWHTDVSTDGATTEPHEITAMAFSTKYHAFNTVWLKWTAPASGAMSVSTLETTGSGTVQDTMVAVFSGTTIKNAKRLAWDDDASTGNTLSEIHSVTIKAGTTYHFQVGISAQTQVAANTDQGSIHLHVLPTYLPAANDNFANAKGEAGTNWTANGQTLGSTLEYEEETENSINSGDPRLNSVWWKWTAQSDGVISVTDTATDLDGYNTGDAYLAVFRDDEDHDFDQVYFSQGTIISDSSQNVYAGNTYYFQLGEVGVFAGGPVALHVAATYTGPYITKVSSTSGSIHGGKTITITGVRFSGVDQVTFGGVAGTNLHVISSTKLTVKTPAESAGTVSIVVQGGGATPNNGVRTYTFH